MYVEGKKWEFFFLSFFSHSSRHRFGLEGGMDCLIFFFLFPSPFFVTDDKKMKREVTREEKKKKEYKVRQFISLVRHQKRN